MKEYKLIKKYPGSPELGTIIYWSPTISKFTVDLIETFTCSEETIINHPEFWEEVKDNNPLRLEVGKEYLLQYVHCDTYPRRVKITRFTKDGYPWMKGVVSDVNGIVSPGHYKLIKEIIEKPLFTTEDGVNIYEGDKYFQLAISFNPNFREAIYEEIARPNITYSYNCKEGREQLNKNGRYYFSTKEAAEEYILMNRPCLSVNDLLNSGFLMREELIKLVKSKL